MLLLFCFASCSPASLQDFRQEGQTVERALIKDLRRIRSHEQLVKARPRLKRHFNKLVTIIIEARKWQDSHPLSEDVPLSKRDLMLSEGLRQELVRVYSFDGGRKTIEECQAPALAKLDLFEQRRAKRLQEQALAR